MAIAGEVLVEPNLALATRVEGEHGGSDEEGTISLKQAFKANSGFL